MENLENRYTDLYKLLLNSLDKFLHQCTTMFIYLEIYINPSTFFIICRAQQARICNFVHLWLGNPPCLESAVEGRGRGRITGGRRRVEEVQTSRQKGGEEPANRGTPPRRQLRVPGGRGPPGSDSRLRAPEVGGGQDPIRP